MKGTFGMIVVAVMVVVGLFLLSSMGRKPPLIPQNAAHRGITTQDGCAACHAPGGSFPLKANHPPKEQCLVCHRTG